MNGIPVFTCVGVIAAYLLGGHAAAAGGRRLAHVLSRLHADQVHQISRVAPPDELSKVEIWPVQPTTPGVVVIFPPECLELCMTWDWSLA